MTIATKPLSNRIAIVFDFDDTLVPDSLNVLLEDLGFNPDSFRQERIQPLIQSGWDKIPARFYALIQESQERENNNKITQDSLKQLGNNLTPFEGVSEMFNQLRKRALDIIPDIEVEFYLITGGFLEIAKNTSIASNFKKMWGCDFHYGEDGEIQFLKKFVTHTEKTRYLFYISKGVDKEKEEDLLFVYETVPQEELYIPLSQMIYVGDGLSDIPCFSILNEYDGIAIGLYKYGNDAKEWEHYDKVSANQRLVNLAPVNYSEDSELMRSLTLSVEKICKQIALRQQSVGE